MKKALMIVTLVLMILIGILSIANAETNWSDSQQNLFQEFFPDYSCEDSYLQDDETVIFIGRKPDGSLVLLCGADEGEDG